MNEIVNVEPATLQWHGEADGHLNILDQTLLPGRIEHVRCHDVPTVVEAIKLLRVRGAPAIGIAGAYGLVIAANEATRRGLSSAAALAHVRQRADELATARPTAVNLQWAVDRLLKLVDVAGEATAIDLLATQLLDEARRIHDEDRDLCAAIGSFGVELVPEGDILTHCNTGSLATGGAGTALGVIVTAWRQGRRFRVFADETRPLLQGARLTAWELVQRQIPVTVLVEGAAAHLLKTGRIGCCIVGADRIAANGDTANKIGTYGLAAPSEVSFGMSAPRPWPPCWPADGCSVNAGRQPFPAFRSFLTVCLPPSLRSSSSAVPTSASRACSTGCRSGGLPSKIQPPVSPATG